MRIEDAYRILEIAPEASAEELKSAHRDLTKVWHPDRFANDPAMQRRAEEKLKAINEAYETLRAHRPGRGQTWSERTGRPDPSPKHAEGRQRLARLRRWMFICGMLGLYILVRRPTFGGLMIALALFAVAGFLAYKSKKLV